MKILAPYKTADGVSVLDLPNRVFSIEAGELREWIVSGVLYQSREQEANRCEVRLSCPHHGGVSNYQSWSLYADYAAAANELIRRTQEASNTKVLSLTKSIAARAAETGGAA